MRVQQANYDDEQHEDCDRMMLDEKPSLSWLADGDWVHFMGIVIWLLLSFMAVAFCIAALAAFARGQIGTAIVMALLGAVLRPTYGWRG